MKKFLTLTAALVLAMSVSAGAGMLNQMPEFDVRAYTMGGSGVNHVIKDQANYWLYP